MKKMFWLLLIVLILQVILRVPFLQVPLERDEGAYGYIAQRMASGEVVYKDMIDHKTPLTYFVYMGFVKLFGNSILSVRIPTLIYSLLTTSAVFGVGLLWLGPQWGVVSAFIYAVFSGGPIIQGSMSNTETFMVLPLLLSLFFFFLDIKKNNIWHLFLSGLFAGIAVLFKQVAMFNFVVLFFAIALCPPRPSLRVARYAFLLSGFILPFILLAAYFLLNGNLSEALFCMINLNTEYLKALPGTFISRSIYGLDVIRSQMLLENGLIWILSVCALVFIFARERKHENLLIASWAIFPFAAMFSTGRYFGHYFIQFIPALVLLSAYAVLKIKENSNFFLAAALLVSLSLPLANAAKYQLPFYSTYNPDEISAQMYGNPEFAVSYRIAEELKKTVRPDEQVLVWSANPEIYFYLGKKSPTKYFNYLYWMKTPARDNEVSKSIIGSNIKYIIKSSYSVHNDELYSFIQKNYSLFLRVGDNIVFKRNK